MRTLNYFYVLIYLSTIFLIKVAYAEKTDISLQEGNDYIVICNDGGAGGYEAFPDVCRLPDGRLFCVFYDGYDHVSMPKETYPKGGRISGIYSTDEGKSWSKPFVVFDGPYDDRDPSVSVIEGKKIICNFFTLKPAESEGKGWEGLGTWMITSEDGGSTWSEPKQLFPDYYCSSPIRTLSDGTLIIGLYSDERKNGCGAVSLSADKGITWSKPIDIDVGNLKLDAEPDLCILKNQSLFIAQRGHSNLPMGFSLSEDGGRTWRKSEALTFPGHCPYLHRSPEGTLIMGIRYPNKGTCISISKDEAKNWSEPLLVDSCIGAYPSMVTLKDNNILIVYYEEGNGSNLRARKFNVDKNGEVHWLTWK